MRVPDAAARWWGSLDEAARDELASLFDPARDDIRVVEGGALEIELLGRFVDPEDALDAGMWRQDFIEYLNAHPEIGFFLDRRSFHICRAHPDARRVLETGCVPHDFACPLGQARCPLATALGEGGGRALVLEARLLRPRSR